MRIVINIDEDWGFALPKSLESLYDKYDGCGWGIRLDPDLIKAVENNIDNCASNLGIVEIPDESTDFDIIEYVGAPEMVVYVIDGRIHYAQRIIFV